MLYSHSTLKKTVQINDLKPPKYRDIHASERLTTVVTFVVVVVFCFKLSILLPNVLFLFSLLCTALCDWLSMKSA